MRELVAGVQMTSRPAQCRDEQATQHESTDASRPQHRRSRPSQQLPRRGKQGPESTRRTDMTRQGTPRDHLALALDVDDLVAALRMARPLLEYFSVAKVGLELFCGVRARGRRGAFDRRVRGLRRPEAARHPDDRRPRGAGARRARRHVRNGAHLGRSARWWRPRPREWPKVRRRPGSRLRASSGSRCSRATRRPRQTSSPAERDRCDAGCGGVVCAASDLRGRAECAHRA